MCEEEMPRGVMTISGDPNPDNSYNSLDDDIEDDTYVPSPRARPHGKGLASASGSEARRDDEIEEEAKEGADGDDGEEEEEVFDVEEINTPNYVDMRPLVFRAPTNPTWTLKVSYRGKTESVRENRRILTRTQPRVKSIVAGISRLSASKDPPLFPHRFNLTLIANLHPPCRICRFPEHKRSHVNIVRRVDFFHIKHLFFIFTIITISHFLSLFLKFIISPCPATTCTSQPFSMRTSSGEGTYVLSSISSSELSGFGSPLIVMTPLGISLLDTSIFL
jgi:hypothetical protein